MGKRSGSQRRTAFKDFDNAEVLAGCKDGSLTKAERKEFVTEAKARGLRNIQKVRRS